MRGDEPRGRPPGEAPALGEVRVDESGVDVGEAGGSGGRHEVVVSVAVAVPAQPGSRGALVLVQGEGRGHQELLEEDVHRHPAPHGDVHGGRRKLGQGQVEVGDEDAVARNFLPVPPEEKPAAGVRDGDGEVVGVRLDPGGRHARRLVARARPELGEDLHVLGVKQEELPRHVQVEGLPVEHDEVREAVERADPAVPPGQGRGADGGHAAVGPGPALGAPGAVGGRVAVERARAGPALVVAQTPAARQAVRRRARLLALGPVKPSVAPALPLLLLAPVSGEALPGA